MEESKKPVQNQRKKRSQSDKIGRLKYNQQLLKQTLEEVEEVKLLVVNVFGNLRATAWFFNPLESALKHRLITPRSEENRRNITQSNTISQLT